MKQSCETNAQKEMNHLVWRTSEIRSIHSISFTGFAWHLLDWYIQVMGKAYNNCWKGWNTESTFVWI